MKDKPFVGENHQSPALLLKSNRTKLKLLPFFPPEIWNRLSEAIVHKDVLKRRRIEDNNNDYRFTIMSAHFGVDLLHLCVNSLQ